MALDTTVGGENAESYISAADADAYFSVRNNSTWTDADDDVKEALLRTATAYLDGRYRVLWKGRRSTAEQALAWPRVHVRDEDGARIDSTTLPRQLRQACAEAAFAEMSSPGVLFPNIERETKLERVGPLEVEYVEGAQPRTTITMVQDLLTGLLLFNGSNTGWLVRA